MPPNSKAKDSNELMNDSNEDFMEDPSGDLKKLVGPQADPNFKLEIRYPHMLILAIYFHLGGLYGLTKIFTLTWATIGFMLCSHIIGMLGVTMGAHRYWSHRSFKAKLPLQIIMMIAFATTYQLSAFWWARSHRLHHKYSDTDADPHNSTRGLLFSHVGWIFVKPHPEVFKQGKLIDISDLENDPVVMFQHKNYTLMVVLLVYVVPIYILMALGNSFSIAWHLNLLRIVTSLNCTWLINSYSHAVGTKPYDKSIVAVQNLPVSFFAVGEGFHNYHHTFPSDYRASELGNNKLNLATLVINAFAYIGWAYDLRTVAQRAVDARAARTGDGTDLWGRNRLAGMEIPSGAKHETDITVA